MRSESSNILNALIERDPIDCGAIATLLDGMTHAERVAATRGLSRANQKRLFEAVQGFRPVGLEDFVPPDNRPFEVVGHVGTNNLPFARKFQKAMYRQADGTLAGRNVQSMSPVTGPGYFTLEPGRHSKDEVVFNYLELPQEKPEGWPDITDNGRGFSYFVYRGLTDVMRGVSKHVSVGHAQRFGKDLPNYFVLVRPDER